MNNLSQLIAPVTEERLFLHLETMGMPTLLMIVRNHCVHAGLPVPSIKTLGTTLQSQSPEFLNHLTVAFSCALQDTLRLNNTAARFVAEGVLKQVTLCSSGMEGIDLRKTLKTE